MSSERKTLDQVIAEATEYGPLGPKHEAAFELARRLRLVAGLSRVNHNDSISFRLGWLAAMEAVDKALNGEGELP